MNLVHASRSLVLYSPDDLSVFVGQRVLPILSGAYGHRVVSVDDWSNEEQPVSILLRGLVAEIKQSVIDANTENNLHAAVVEAVERLFGRNSRPVVVYLGNLEQLLAPERRLEVVELFRCLQTIVDMPCYIRVVLSLREEQLGLFRHLTRGVASSLRDDDLRVEV